MHTFPVPVCLWIFVKLKFYFHTKNRLSSFFQPTHQFYHRLSLPGILNRFVVVVNIIVLVTFASLFACVLEHMLGLAFLGLSGERYVFRKFPYFFLIWFFIFILFYYFWYIFWCIFTYFHSSVRNEKYLARLY